MFFHNDIVDKLSNFYGEKLSTDRRRDFANSNFEHATKKKVMSSDEKHVKNTQKRNAVKSKAYKMLYNLKNQAMKDTKSSNKSNKATPIKTHLKNNKTQTDGRCKTP